MTLRASELDAACRALVEQLGSGGRPVQKITQPDDHTIVLGLGGPWLLLSADSELGRLHLVEKPAGTGRDPTAFCMLLRKHLEGGRLVGAEAVPGERAATLSFATSRGPRALRLFLYGRAAQLVLLDDAGRALGHIGPARAVHHELPLPREPSAESRFAPGPTVLDEIARFYAERAATRSEQTTRAHHERRLRTELSRLERLGEALGHDLARAERAPILRRHADLVLAHLREIPRGASIVSLPDDFADGAPVEITLDPALDARRNAEKMYRQQRRLERARAQIAERLGKVHERAAALRAQLEGLASGAPLPPEALRPTPLRGGGSRAEHAPGHRAGTRGPAPRRAEPYHAFRGTGDAAILVGRGAARNDELTFKIARGSDLWLHVRDGTGAHVVVPLGDGGTAPASLDSLPSDLLVDAAMLAAHFSTLRDEEQVDVMYALRKHLRKAKGAPGRVHVSQSRTIRVRMQPERLERLLATRP